MKPLPCPFCGFNAKIIERYFPSDDYDDDRYYDVTCTNDDCYLSGGGGMEFWYNGRSY